MDVRGGNKNMNTGMLGFVHGLEGLFDITLLGTRQAEHNGSLDLFGDPIHGIKVTLRRSSKSRLDDINFELVELAR